MRNSELDFESNLRQNNHQVQMNHLRSKYINFVNSKNQKTSNWVFNAFLRTSYDLFQKCWNFLVPKFIRGNSTEFQTFKKLWLQNYDEAVPLLVQRESLEKALNSQIRHSIIILGICYISRNFGQIKEIIDKINHQADQIKIKPNIFPIAIQGQYFKQEFQSKLQYKRDSILLLYKNIFDQLTVLDQISAQRPFYLGDFLKTFRDKAQIESDVKNSIINQSKQNITIETGSSTTISIKINSSRHKKFLQNVKSPFQ